MKTGQQMSKRVCTLLALLLSTLAVEAVLTSMDPSLFAQEDTEGGVATHHRDAPAGTAQELL
jgi:hypothetical protein